MEVECDIDPLSMLEQSMQVNDYTVTSNGDQDVVMLCDDDQEGTVEVPDDDPTIINCEESDDVPDQSVDLSDEGIMVEPDIEITEDDEMVANDVSPNNHDEYLQQLNSPMYVLAGPSVEHNEPVIDESMGFGDHFLLDPGPSNSTPQTMRQVRSSNNSTSVRVDGINGRNRSGIKRAVAFPTQVKPKKILPLVNNKVVKKVVLNKVDDAAARSTAANTKLVNNVKRLSFASPDEQTYRQRVFNDNQKVLASRLDCTVCGKHIGCTIDLNVFMVTHPMLKVLMCTKCREAYCSEDWSLDSDNKDTRCRWCSKQNVGLKNCKDCPFAFCFDCMSRNYSKRDSNKIMNLTHWRCFVCQMVPLYFMRATCWALNLYISSLSRRKNRELFKGDLSKCCKKGSTSLINLVDDDVTEVLEQEDSNSNSAIPNASQATSNSSALSSTLASANIPMSARTSTSVKLSVSSQPGFTRILSTPRALNRGPGVINRKISTSPILSRIDVLFSGVDNVKQSIKCKLMDSVSADDVNNLASEITQSLTKITKNVDSCLLYIQHWRHHMLENNKKVMAPTRNQFISINPNKFKLKSKINGTNEYSFLLKKYNIKPCQVKLEKIDIPEHLLNDAIENPDEIDVTSDGTLSANESTETSEPPNFFLSLIPETVIQEINLSDDDNSIICLDD